MPFIRFDLREAEEELGEMSREVMLEIANELVNQLQQEAPVGATGDLRRSFQIFTTEDNVVWVGTRIPYASHVNYGTGPHTPPFEDIRVWSRRKLGAEDAAGAIWNKIRTEGTDANPFVDRSIENTVSNVGQLRFSQF